MSLPEIVGELSKFTEELRDQQVVALTKSIEASMDSHGRANTAIQDILDRSKLAHQDAIDEVTALRKQIIADGNAMIDDLKAQRDAVAGGLPIAIPKPRKPQSIQDHLRKIESEGTDYLRPEDDADVE